MGGPLIWSELVSPGSPSPPLAKSEVEPIRMELWDRTTRGNRPTTVTVADVMVTLSYS